jgi:hypothetical protein
MLNHCLLFREAWFVCAVFEPLRALHEKSSVASARELVLAGPGYRLHVHGFGYIPLPEDLMKAQQGRMNHSLGYREAPGHRDDYGGALDE